MQIDLRLDAGADSSFKMTDFSRLVRTARIKHGIEISPIMGADQNHNREFLNSIIPKDCKSTNESRNKKGSSKESSDRQLIEFSDRHYLLFQIKYPAVEHEETVREGLLVLMKSTLTGDEPIELLKYVDVNNDFPHDTTTDQFYDSTKFESYRFLGEHIGKSVLEDLKSICEDKEKDVIQDQKQRRQVQALLKKNFAIASQNKKKKRFEKTIVLFQTNQSR